MSTGSELVIKKTSNLPAVVDENSLVSYFEKIRNIPVLSEDEERRLVTAFHENGDLSAAQKLVASHLRLSAKIALTYRRYGLPLADLISEGNLGLMQAVKKFDLTKQVRLSTYAIWWIKAAINDFVLRSWSLVKIGTRAAQKKLFYNLNRIKSRLGLYENKELEPSVVKAIAKELVVEEREVLEMNGRMNGDRSLNVCIADDDETEKIDLLVDNKQNIEASLAAKQEHNLKAKVLYNCISKLDEREQFIIKHRMLTDAPTTLEEIGVKFNVSRERIRQIEKKAFDKLKMLVMLDLKEKM